VLPSPSLAGHRLDNKLASYWIDAILAVSARRFYKAEENTDERLSATKSGQQVILGTCSMGLTLLPKNSL
jgi:hypothetical protein